MVFEREPVFLSSEEVGLLPTGAVILSAAEFAANSAMAPLDLYDSYDLYRMDRKGLSVAFLTPDEFERLSAAVRQELMAFQARRGRGQIYASLPWATDRDRFTLDGGPRAALRHDVWWRLTMDERRAWLLQFVNEGRESCLSGTLREEQWSRFGPVARALAGTFAPTSGPNCFGLALAAAAPSVVLARSIAGHWLHPEPFMRGLASRGYTERGDLSDDGSNLPPGAVITFVDDDGRPQHACFYLGDGLALNKDGQAWFIPRQIRPVGEVLENWRADGFMARVWTGGTRAQAASS